MIKNEKRSKNMQEQLNKAEVIPSPIHHGLVVYVSLGDIGDIGGWDYMDMLCCLNGTQLPFSEKNG